MVAMLKSYKNGIFPFQNYFMKQKWYNFSISKLIMKQKTGQNKIQIHTKSKNEIKWYIIFVHYNRECIKYSVY